MLTGKRSLSGIPHQQNRNTIYHKQVTMKGFGFELLFIDIIYTTNEWHYFHLVNFFLKTNIFILYQLVNLGVSASKSWTFEVVSTQE